MILKAINILNFFLDKMGFCLRKTRTISFREKKSHPLEQLYQVGNVENKVTILMNISVSKCRTQIWNTLEVNNNPFVKTLYDYGRNNTLNFDNSELKKYYECYQPKNASEVLKLHHEYLKDLPPHSFIFPWETRDIEVINKKRQQEAFNEN